MSSFLIPATLTGFFIASLLKIFYKVFKNNFRSILIPMNIKWYKIFQYFFLNGQIVKLMKLLKNGNKFINSGFVIVDFRRGLTFGLIPNHCSDKKI